VLRRYGVRLAARLVPRLRAAWPAIAGIALAVVLAHSGVAHLQSPHAVDEYYRMAFGSTEWTRTVGIAQLFIAGGLCLRRTRMTAAAALAVLVALAVANQWRIDRLGVQLWADALMLSWSLVIAWGEARRARTGTQPGATLRGP
jgi:hypothetical protein